MHLSRNFLFLSTLLTLQLSAQQGIHPLMKMENAYPENEVALKISAMAFQDQDLYLTVFTPDRTNKAPFMEGEVFRVTGLTSKEPILAEKLMGGLYEPTAIASFKGKIYIGEKDKISRLDDKNGDGKYSADEKTVLIDGLSQPNFHTYTIGFKMMEREGKTYLSGNLTTSILLGGSRDFNVTVNPKTHRGSTFIFGPITGSETPADVDIDYIAGGYRTPNGYTVTSDGAAVVVDNQGIFNPTNEFIRTEQGGFYGHYLLKRDDTNIAAFQPEDVDSEIGGSKHQLPPTVHMPQRIVARSPAEPLELTDLKGHLSVYNGQFLIPDVTLGTMTRIFTEQVEGTWQGVVFKHSSGYDPKGENGFTAGPNRLIQGPDNNYYVGGIGEGGLWRILDAPGEPYTGLQRLSFRKKAEVPASFNEMVAVRNTAEGFEIEFFKALEKAPTVEMRHWTYIPTKGYGGSEFGLENLTAKSTTLSADGKRLSIAVDGLRDNSSPFIQEKGYSNENVGWVVNIKIKDENLWASEAWYTLISHQGKTSDKPIGENKSTAAKDPIGYAKTIHASVCAACHAIDGQQLVGPNFRGLFGREQTVIGKSGKKKKVTVDEKYLVRAIMDPMREYPEGFPPAMPDPNLLNEEAEAIVKWIKTLK
ncbi:MAG: cytochrome c [Akkermansiaceae bacterium]|nr:cytochrome c [Akkermansiaceae bacterium]